ncbi:Nn.00g108030.m01.CDS01 [Neocucurbitaria sp. VM-36]
MNSVRAIQQLNKRELESGINPEGSWHTDYRDTAFVYIGGLPFELSEGDIITIFSQYGEPVWIKLARDRETGKSRGFAWIKYEDQRSCDLAVDNLGGSTIMDRVIRVDHARYKPKDDEDMRDNTMGDLELDHGNESDEARRKRRKTESESDSDDDRPLLPEEIELGRLMEKLDEDDPMRESMIKRQQEKVDDALKKLKKSRRKEKERERRKHRHRHRDGSKARRDHRRIKHTEEEAREERHSRHKAPRSRSDDDSSGDDRRRRDRSRERRATHKDKRDQDTRDRHRERARRSPSSVDEDDERPRSKRSPLPYRARSPRRDRNSARSPTPERRHRRSKS